MARRNEKKKEQRQSIPVLIGAGITEQWYFTHLKALRKFKMQIRPRFFGNEHIHTLEKNVEMVLATEGRAIVVFDTDVTQWDQGERTRLEAFRRKYAKDSRVILCESMPSIEYWFLLHYASTNRHFGTSKAVIAELSKYVNLFDKTERFLSNPKWVWDMSAEGRLENAMKRAETLGRNGESYTDVWKAIKVLIEEA